VAAKGILALLPVHALLPHSACSDDGPTEIRVFAAASLTSSFTELGKAFEASHEDVKVVFSFAGSAALAQQITQAAPADVFASASTRTMDTVDAEVTDVEAFAINTAEIAVDPASSIASLADLAKPGVKLALCATEVPCGALADRVLANARVAVRPVTRGLDVKATLGYVTNGSADAAIVYVTDVLAAGDTVKGVPIPADVNASTTYEIATVTASRHADLAGQFHDFVLSSDGQAALAKAGFSRP
jgi:molybdate transport system substrate-binding protein